MPRIFTPAFSLLSQNKKTFLIIIILIVINLPYLVNIQQDLLTEPVSDPIVCHDEAAFAMNAKNILLFGPGSLAGDRIYVLGPLNIAVNLISFFFFGISLASLRIPFIIFNVLGNLAFFDLLRRAAGKKIAVIAASFFALFFSHIVIGKSAMAEASILPILLVLSWLMFFTPKHPRLYFWLGFLAMLAGINKPDNLAVFLILVIYAFFDGREERKGLSKKASGLGLRWLFFGATAAILLWLIYIAFIGFKQFLFYYRCELFYDDVRALRFGFYGKPGSFELIKNNLSKIWAWDPLFTAFSFITVAGAAICSLFDRGVWRNPVFRAGLLFLGLFAFKIIFSGYFVGQWRVAPCYPLPFLALVYIWMARSKLTQPQLNHPWKRYGQKAAIILGLGILFYILPLVFKSVKLTGKLIFQPTYRILKNVERLRKELDPAASVIFSEGHFTYVALFLPNRCYDVVPNLEAKEFDLLESDPVKIWETVQFDKKTAYLMVRPVNQAVMKFADAVPGAKLLTTDALPFDEGYVYQIRWPQWHQAASPLFLGKWEEE